MIILHVYNVKQFKEKQQSKSPPWKLEQMEELLNIDKPWKKN
jgi:hypothetical protein